MGGERETVVTQKPRETTIQSEIKQFVAPKESGLSQKIRIHENAGEIHFHDDDNKLKVSVPVAEWWSIWKKSRSNLHAIIHYVDANNNTLLEIQPQLTWNDSTNNNVEVFVRVSKLTLGTTFQSLDKFTNLK